MGTNLVETDVELAALDWFQGLGYSLEQGPKLAPGESTSERDSFGDVVLVGRLREAIQRLNPAIPEEAHEEALRKVLRVGTPSLTQTNRAFHKMLRDGVPVEYSRADGSIAGDHVRLIDFQNPAANNWLAINQFTIIEGQHNRRPDIVVFVNGMPLGLIELKNAADEDATVWSAYAQLQTYSIALTGPTSQGRLSPNFLFIFVFMVFFLCSVRSETERTESGSKNFPGRQSAILRRIGNPGEPVLKSRSLPTKNSTSKMTPQFDFTPREEFNFFHMSITVQLDLPDTVAREAKAKGLLSPQNLTRLVEREIALDKPMEEFRAMVEQMRAYPEEPMTMDEVQSVVNEVRARRRTSR